MSVIEDVKQHLDIVQVIGEYVSLQRAGRNFKAPCPFHQERTPSFFVFPDRQSWHCFGGCATGGDVFTFLEKKENIDFGEALRLLAQKAGVALLSGPATGEQEQGLSRLRQANEAAAQYYQHMLIHDVQAEEARAYLKQRGVSEGTLERFQLGYSLEGWYHLRLHLMERGFSEEELLAAGLLALRQSSGQAKGETKAYDVFRGRLLFPIRDGQGRVVGFGARALDGSAPKYLNTPQTELFDKGALLYGLDQARSTIREQGLAIIVEGYMDVLTAHQHGFTNVVASMGTSLTEKQVNLLKRLTKTIALALDADAGGQEATFRGLEVATQALEKRVVPVPTGNRRELISYKEVPDGDIRVVVVPAGRDPDEVIREDPATWQRLVQESRSTLDHLCASVAERFNLADPRGKSQAVQWLLPIVAEMKDPIRWADYVQRVARLMQVDERTLQAALPQDSSRRSRRPRASPEEHEDVSAFPSRDVLEEYCLTLLLRHPQLRGESQGLREEHFTWVENREVFLAWRQASSSEALQEALSEHLHRHLAKLLATQLLSASHEELRRDLAQCQERLEERRLRQLKQQEGQLLLQAEDPDGVQQVAQPTFAQWQGHEVEEPTQEDAAAAALLQVQHRSVDINEQMHRIFVLREGKTKESYRGQGEESNG